MCGKIADLCRYFVFEYIVGVFVVWCEGKEIARDNWGRNVGKFRWNFAVYDGVW